MHLLNHLLSNIAVDYYRSIHPFLGSPFHQKVVNQISDVVSGVNQMKLLGKMWQRSDQVPVFDAIAMKDNEDEEVNDTYINNCFNQIISQFVLCERASTDVLRTMSIPNNSTPSTSVTATCWLQTVKP